jgi:Anti-sigma-K factor rskA
VSSPDNPIGDHPLDDLAAYALDALDGSERDALADHLVHCLACQDELDAHRETLALLAPHEEPPAAVWQRVVASIRAPGLPDVDSAQRAQSSLTASGASSVTGPDRRVGAVPVDAAGDGADAVVRPMPSPAQSGKVRDRRPFRLGGMAAAAIVAVALAIGGAVGFALGSSGDDADIGSLAERASEDPSGQTATLVSPSGEPVARVVTDEDGAYVVLDGLENLPDGRAYQLWSLTESEPVSLGMLGRDGTNTVAFRLPPTITELAISEAPTSGDATPTGEFLASGTVTHA